MRTVAKFTSVYTKKDNTGCEPIYRSVVIGIQSAKRSDYGTANHSGTGVRFFFVCFGIFSILT